jgi:hypothetical protein
MCGSSCCCSAAPLLLLLLSIALMGTSDQFLQGLGVLAMSAAAVAGCGALPAAAAVAHRSCITSCCRDLPGVLAMSAAVGHGAVPAAAAAAAAYEDRR